MDGPPPPEEDFSTLSIEDRLSHKNWKARVSGYEALVKVFQTTADDNDPAFRPYISSPDLLKKIVTDSNAVAQEKGVECVVAFVKFAGENAARSRDVVIPALVDKCLGSARAGTRNQAIELALQYVEVENNGAGVAGDIIPGLSAKQPKVVAGCVMALKEIIRLFGIQVTPPQPVLKAIPKIFGHTDKTVRAEGAALTQALYQYMGPAIESFLGDLKPVQVKELKESFESLETEGKGRGTLKPERLTRAAAREAEVAAANDVDEDNTVAEEAAPPDPRMFAEEVNVVAKFPTGYEANLKSSKWKERKEALDEMLTVLQATLRIQAVPELGDISKSLAIMIQKDANIMCVIVAAQCLEALGKGLGEPFGRYREAIVPPMLERLKERKTNVTDAIGQALDAVFAATSLAEIIPDILPALSNKNPQIKEGASKFICRCLSTSPTPIPPALIKPLSDPLATLMEDSFEGARNEAAACLGTLMKMVGERPLGALMEGLADVRKAKVKEAFEKATVKAKAGAGGPPKAPPKAAAPPAKAPAPKKAAAPKAAAPPEEEQLAPPPPVKKAPAADELADLNAEAEAKPKRAPPARFLAKKAPAAGGEESAAPAAASAPAAAAPKKVPPAAAVPKGKAPPPAPPGQLDTFKYKFSSEDAEGLIAELIPTNFQTELGDSQWKVRLAALEEMTTWVDGQVDELESELVVRFLAKKGFNEKNFNVSGKLYGILSLLAERCPSFGRASAAICIPHLSEKLGDPKLKKPAGDTLGVFAEKTSLQFVLGQAYDTMSKQKAPKFLADALAWIDTSLREFGIAGLALRNLIDFIKVALGNSNAAVRTSATKTLVTVKLFAGPSVKDLLGDLNPQLMNTISSEFDKVEGTPAPEPTRTSVDVAVMSSGTGGGKGAAAVDALDDLFPRVELDGLLKGTTILADAKSEAWKTKKEALELLQAILDQGPNKRLKPTMGEIAQVLKARVVDANKAVQSLALDIVARIATGMGKPFEKQTRFFTISVATVLSDQKAPIRASALATLTAMANACEGLETMVNDLGKALETPNPLQRANLLNWIADWFKEHEPGPHLDLHGWASTVVSILDDKSGDVRKAAQALLPVLISTCGYDYVMKQADSLKPASKKSAVPVIQAAHAAAPTKAAPTSVAGPAKAASAPKAAPASHPVAPSPSPPPPESIPAAAPKLAPLRKKLPLGAIPRTTTDSRPQTPDEGAPRLAKLAVNGIRKPGAPATKPTPATPVTTSIGPFTSANMEAKKARLAKDAQRWVNEAGPTRKDLAELLQHQMEPHSSRELIALLFSHDHNAVNDHVNGLSSMCDFYTNADTEDVRPVAIANIDLPLKYVSIKAHEPQSNIVSRCLDVVDAVLAFLRNIDYQLSDAEAMCFIPTMIYKLGDAREPVRVRVQQIIQALPKVYAYSRLFSLLLDYGLKSKVAKTRQGALDEMAGIIKRSGMGACDPPKAMPQVASMIADKDPNVRKSSLSVLSEAYVLIGEKIWSLVGHLTPKDKTQLEERLRRVAGPSSPDGGNSPLPISAAPISRIASGDGARPASPSVKPRLGGLPRPGASAVPTSRLARAASPGPARALSPVQTASATRIASSSGLPGPSSPRSKLQPPSRLGAPKSRVEIPKLVEEPRSVSAYRSTTSGHSARPSLDYDSAPKSPEASNNVSIVISTILSNDPTRSVDALKRIQDILKIKPEAGPSSEQYRDLAEHTEGLVETITLQMGHVFEKPDDIVLPENFRLAKHLIQTLNAFCDHVLLAESLTVESLTSLLEELTLRLLETDDSHDSKVKDLSRFINMIILRLFATARRMSIFRSLFSLLLQIVKPFPANGTLPDSKEAKIAELVLKCIWKLARNMPQDLENQTLDPVELFPAIEHFLQSVPPNEWRARATNKVPCGDMPLRTIKVIIQHVVAHYSDDVYDLLSQSFDDPSATIVYPYVYRILNSSTRVGADNPSTEESDGRGSRLTRATSPQGTISSISSLDRRARSPDHRGSQASESGNGHTASAHAPPSDEPDPDDQLMVIIKHISSETTGALHKEGITELHHFLKSYPHKKARVDKMLESTGPAFRKYITRALASRAAEDQERDAAVSQTLSKLEGNNNAKRPTPLASPNRHVAVLSDAPVSPRSPTRSHGVESDRLSKLHDIFQYRPRTSSVDATHQLRDDL